MNMQTNITPANLEKDLAVKMLTDCAVDLGRGCKINTRAMLLKAFRTLLVEDHEIKAVDHLARLPQTPVTDEDWLLEAEVWGEIEDIACEARDRALTYAENEATGNGVSCDYAFEMGAGQ